MVDLGTEGRGGGKGGGTYEHLLVNAPADARLEGNFEARGGPTTFPAYVGIFAVAVVVVLALWLRMKRKRRRRLGLPNLGVTFDFGCAVRFPLFPCSSFFYYLAISVIVIVIVAL